jgi:hypothetical protein
VYESEAGMVTLLFFQFWRGREMDEVGGISFGGG